MLTDAAVRSFKPELKPYKKFDRDGLHLVVTPAGGKLWRMKYRYNGKERLLSFGPYPSMSLSAARTARDEARAAIRDGRDPGATRKLRKLSYHTATGTTFEAIAREWYDLKKSQWVARHADDVITSLEREVFPILGGIPANEISAADVMAVMRKIEARSKETARRVRQRMSAVFAHAISTGRADNNPAAAVKEAMAPMKKGRQPAIVELEPAREMLARAEAEVAHPVTKLALRILALTVVRPGTLTGTPWLEWSDLDDESPTWRIPAERMKMRLHHKDDAARDHHVPLARQTVEAIEALRIASGRGPLAFPNARHAHKPMSENAMGYLLNRAGYHGHHVPHGWRSTFSSVMNERFPQDHRIIDLMLAHSPKDKVESAYNRAQHMERRRELAQAWADLILEDAQPAASLLLGPRR